MTRLVLARHGESVWHREDRYAGSSDIDLTDRGRVQAGELGDWAAGQNFSAIWSSPLRRAHDTAAAAALSTGLIVHTDDRLRELDFGVAEGVRRDEIEQRHPVDYAAFVEAPVTHHFPQGQDPAPAARAMLETWREIAALHPTTPGRAEQRVLVVAHATVFRLGLCAALGIDLDHYRRAFPRMTNGSVAEIDVSAHGVGLLSLNVALGSHGDSA